MSEKDVLTFFVNGSKVTEENADPEVTLLTYLRNKLRLTGSKLGCGEGGCGACTVMVSKWDKDTDKVKHFAVNACLAPVVSMHNCAVTTVEGIGSTKTKLHDVQKRLAAYHGSQCGFCTPGFVMSMYTLLRNKRVPDFKDVETCLQGNLCRCTGYRPIISAFKTFTCEKGENCCRNKNGSCNTTDTFDKGDENGWNSYDPTQEPIFPPTLRLAESNKSTSLTFVGESITWHQPADLAELLALKNLHPDAKIVVGNTEVGIELNIKGFSYKRLIHPIDIPEMFDLKETNGGVLIGASCSLTKVGKFLKKVCFERPKEETQIFEAILKMLDLFAGAQIRNVACIGGNIMTGSPISDLNPILMACGAKLTFDSQKQGRREIVMDDTFFTGYRRTNTHPEDVLISIFIPFLSKNDVMEAFKQSKRKDDDIAIVNSAMIVSFEPESNIVRNLSMTFGGMAAVTKMAKKTMNMAKGRQWNESFLDDAFRSLVDEMELTIDAPGGMVQYRRTLVISFFFKFYHRVYANLVERRIAEENNVKQSRMIIDELSAEKCPFTSKRSWEEVDKSQSPSDAVGRSMPHVSGLKQVTGEAQYLDDIPPYRDELNMALIFSRRTHAKILSVDTTEALKSFGVVDYVDVRDVKGKNVTHFDEQVFADGKVTCVGDVIGGILADTHDHAIKAARLVKIKYEDLSPKIVTIEDAIKHNSYYEVMKLVKGDLERGFQECDYVIEDEVRVGGQEHFYLETQGSIAIPRNGENEMEIWSSSQDPTALQRMAAACLGVPRHKVLARTKRLGGGFGGKETKFCLVSSPTAVAAQKTGKPVRCVLTRQDDMQITGGRHPFLGRYKIGFNKNGCIKCLDVKLYSNGGNTSDLSSSVMEKAVRQADNSYQISNMTVTGYVCQTNVASNTAFRGFGSPQTNIVVEDWITRVAQFLDMEPEKVRELNMLKNGDEAVYGCEMTDLKLKETWDQCMAKSDYHEHRKLVDEFNKNNRWKKRGISCVSSKFNVGFGVSFLNQGGALVLVYADGSVLISHGGTEMGQGLHTKMIQVASRALGISTEYVHIAETSTASVPNASATAASVGSDINGMAVKLACEKIKKRLMALQKANPGISWPALIEKAYFERISLSATGFFSPSELTNVWDRENGTSKGEWSLYTTSGASMSIVEIDVLTGHHAILRSDIVLDVGKSLNPAVDIGQIEGAFTQGYGLVTMEEPLHSSTGQLWTVGPGSYKIPGMSDTPRSFNIHFLKDSPNEKAVYSSRAVGEPPLLLATSVICAIKDAIKSARKDVGITGPFRLDSPATAERIRIACKDRFTDMAQLKDELCQGRTPWSVRT